MMLQEEERKMEILVKYAIGAVLSFGFLFYGGCGQRGDPESRVIVFHAGSLATPMREMGEVFEKLHPGVEVLREASGSRVAARKVSDLGRLADIVATSDYSVIEELLMPEHTHWYAKYARNRMVIAYTDRSKYGDEIDSENWYEILVREGVNYGRSDPNLDPCGYRTLMVWHLADLYYERAESEVSIFESLSKHCPPNNVRPSEIELLPLLESLALDYAFEYLSIAVQHHLKYVELPEEIDLSNPRYKELYALAKVDVTGKKPGTYHTVKGTPIVYALTIPKAAPHHRLAVEFTKFMLGREGQAIMRRSGQPPLSPARVNEILMVPPELERFVRQE